MKTQEPIRWLDQASQLSSELRDALGAAEIDEPSSQQLSSLSARLSPLLGPAVGPASPSQGAAPLSVKAKVIVGLVVTSVSVASFEAGRLVERREEAVQPAPVLTEAAPQPAVVVVPESASPPTTARPKPAIAKSRPAPVPAASPPLSGDEELELIAAAYQALQEGNAEGALARVEAMAAKLPHGQLAQEREVIAVDALIRLGRRAEAEARAERFHRDYPTSTHSMRIRGLLSGGEPLIRPE